MTPPESGSDPSVGSRLSCDGHIGTLLYIGEVPPTKGTWFGVDWDDPSRGKHDGTYHEVKYFETSQFHQLTVVCVRDHLVNGPGPAGALQALCPDVTELDISRNLLNSWRTVAQIAAQLKKLQHLNVSENRLQLVDDPLEHQGSFQSLKQLVAWDMKYDWSHFLACARMWPDIEELKVANNNITTLESPPCGVLSRLKHLDLHGNNIQDWEEINKLGSLNMLEYLNASSIGVSRIHFPAASSAAKTHLFPALKHLNIDNNNIQESASILTAIPWRPSVSQYPDSNPLETLSAPDKLFTALYQCLTVNFEYSVQWVSVSELNKLAALEDLKLRDNPVTNLEKMESTVQIIIARIANLKMLNAEAVSVDRKGANAAFISNDRKGAEYDYVKKHGREWLSVIDSEADRERFLTQHPRFPELIRTLEFVSPNEPEKKIVQKLPRSIQVNKVVAFAKQLFNTGGKTPSLSYVDTKLPDTEVPIDNIMRDLKFYSVEDGGQIVVRW
uniref:Tubulin-specific chaperone E n=1 Tax=Timema cristinae TaxID=61476 RepID=A0A7R9DAY4_TIMCR|nr:unnamed protein product [Timema cristinae]